MLNPVSISFDPYEANYGSERWYPRLVTLILALALLFAVLSMGTWAQPAVTAAEPPTLLVLTQNESDDALSGPALTVAGIYMAVPAAMSCLTNEAQCCLLSQSAESAIVTDQIVQDCAHIVEPLQASATAADDVPLALFVPAKSGAS